MAGTPPSGVSRSFRWLPLVLLPFSTGTICRASSAMGPGSGSTPVSTTGTGSFSGTDASGKPISVTFFSADVYLETAVSDAGVESSWLAVAKLGGENGTEELEIASPSDVLAATFDADLALPAVVSPGTYGTDGGGSAGNLALAYSTRTAGEGFSATSWTLDLTSVPADDGGPAPDSPVYAIVDGTLAAILTDGKGGSGTLNLTF